METDDKLSIPSNWSFERDDVAEKFDAHVREQLPWYELVTRAVAHIVRCYLPMNGRVYDIGASNGNIGRAIAGTLQDRAASLIPIEPSKDMAARYSGPGSDSLLVRNALEVQYERFDVAVCFLVMMFIQKEDRTRLIETLLHNKRDGGAIIIVDKLVAAEGYLSTVMWRMTMGAKLKGGASPAEVLEKEMSLCGVQRPISIDELPPNAVKWFQFGEFAGWVIE